MQAPPAKRPPKGHRQKGAGTMVVSKGEVKRDGLDMKEWQKSPKQLLKEYCQGEKRPLPRYVTSSTLKKDKVLFRVVLPDPKDQKEKDLTFVPKDAAFDTQVEAEHAVALLALAKMDGARAHEMKLPEPYKTAWLNLVGRKAEVAASAASTAAAAAAFKCPSCSKSFAKAHALEHHQKKEHPVIAPLLPQVAAATPPVVTTPTPPVSTPTPPPPAAPAALLNLKSSSKFTSISERRLAEEERAREENKRKSNINRNAHNENEVFMSEENRLVIEQIVKEANELFTHLDDGDDDDNKEASIDGGGVDLLVKQVMKLGFGEADARSAFEQGKAKDTSMALDWLLLNLSESNLPSAFDPRGMQLEVVKNTASAALQPTAAAAAAASCALLPYPSKSQITLDQLQAWFTQEQPSRAQQHGVAEGDDWDTLAAILGEENVSRIAESMLRLRVGVNTKLHSKEEIYIDFAPATKQFLLRGLSNDDLALKTTRKLYEEMQAQVLPGEACAYFLWDTCRQMDKPAMASSLLARQQQQAKPQAANTTKAKQERARVVRTILTNPELDAQNQALTQHLARRPKMASREHLPASAYKQEIINAVSNHSVVIIKGETGCGKTTQVPQFIFEHMIATGSGAQCNIIVTQPRRLAAISVAQRVAEEFGGKLGEEIGYRVQLDSRVSPKLTRVEFCTTGLLLRRLEFEGDHMPCTHIFVDEIHERSLDSDFLLAMLKHQVLARRPDVKIILMSATMDANRFSQYFGGNAPVLQIPGRTFPVTELFVEDIPVERNYDLDFYSYTAQCVAKAHEVTENAEGSILVFVSGVNEINRTIAACEQQLPCAASLLLLGLHGNSPTGQNQAVFARAPRGKRKVIVCTNVCETSITIPDCVVVIDTGKAKEVRYDGANKFSSLEEDWISQANAQQRKGRAGRVQAGVCWKLYSKHRQLEKDQLAEVHRVPLDNICLAVAHHLRNDPRGDLQQFFRTLIEPPSPVNVQAAIDTLVEINALDTTEKNRLTPLGQHLVKLPMDAQLGKLLIYGSLLSVPRELAIATASLCRSKSIFLPDADRKSFERGSQSDHLATIAAFEQWEQSKQRKEFCTANGLDANVLREVAALVNEFLANLDRIGFASKPARQNAPNSDMNRRKRIKACLCVLAPSVLRIKKPQKRYVQMSGGAVETEDYDSREIRYFPLRSNTSGSEQAQVYIHPSSVNFTASTYYSNFMVYSSLMQTSKLFARDCTCVSPYGLILFASTEVSVSHETGTLRCDGGKMTFKCSARVGVLVKEIKKLLDKLLQAKIEDSQSLSQISFAVMDACIKLVEGDGYSN